MRISGLSSGLDIEQIVSDLVRAQRTSLDKVYQQKVKAEWQRDAYRDVNTKLLRFRNLAFDFTLQGTFMKKTAVSSRTDILTAIASGQAVEGKYELKVEKLATAARFTWSAPEVIETVDPDDPNPAVLFQDGEFKKSGEFQIGTSPDKMVTISFKEGDTLASIASKINAAKVGINAFAHEGQISFTTTATGKDAKFYVDDQFKAIFGDDLADATGSDAEVTINGITVNYSSNNFEFNGISVNLLEQSDATVTIEVKHDVDAVVEKVKEFVNLYNELVAELNGLVREEVYRDFAPLTEEQKEAMSDKEIELWEQKAKSGLLRSDTILNSILSEMRTALGGVVATEEGSLSLRQMGITTGSWYEYGKLYLDENKLREAVEKDPDAVRDLFTKPAANEGDKNIGLARRLISALDKGMDRITERAGKATYAYDQSFLGNRIREYESRLEVLEERLLRYEEAQWKKFTALETALSKLYSQSDWLYQQIAAMQG